MNVKISALQSDAEQARRYSRLLWLRGRGSSAAAHKGAGQSQGAQ